MLCNNQQLLHDFLETNPTEEQWRDIWFANIMNHPRNEGWAHLANGLWHAGYTLIMLTARPEAKRETTEEWLVKWGIPFDHLVMRQEDQSYHECKAEHLVDLMKEFIIALAIDDDPTHIAEYERLGVPSIHAHNGLNAS